MDTHLSLILKCGHNKQCSKIESSKEKYKTGTQQTGTSKKLEFGSGAMEK